MLEATGKLAGAESLDTVPAVTVPCGLMKAGLSDCSFSILESPRQPLSVSITSNFGGTPTCLATNSIVAAPREKKKGRAAASIDLVRDTRMHGHTRAYSQTNGMMGQYDWVE